jgi:murein endopeptidase
VPAGFALRSLLLMRVRTGAALLLAATALVPASAGAQTPGPDAGALAPEAPQPDAPRSIAVGVPWHGRLERGVQLPAAGTDFVTWDPILRVSPNREWRRWGTDALIVLLDTVTREFREAHPDVPPILIADLSRPKGGPFGRRYGGLGHGSHQNGLDADVMYPRRDRAPLAALRPSEVDRALAQDLVDRFRAAGAVRLFVGPHLHLHGPRSIVVPLVHHDDHVHVRIANPRRSARNAP